MESKRSCCSKEKVCGIRVEKACYIFAIINAVLVSASFVGCLVYIGYLCDLYFRPDRHSSYETDGLAVALNEILCIILSLSTVVAFIFAVLLCHGVHKKLPSFVMAYFVYGILVEILSVGGIIAFIVEAIDMEDVEMDRVAIAVAAFVGCVIYIFPLILVRRTYVKFANAPTNAANTSLLQGI